MSHALSWFNREQDKARGMPLSQEHLLIAHGRLVDAMCRVQGMDMSGCDVIQDDLKKWLLSGGASRVTSHFDDLRVRLEPYRTSLSDDGVWHRFMAALISLVVYASESSDFGFRNNVIALSKRLPQ